MEQDHGDNHDWPMQRRVEGFVNKHMADIAVEALQQRLSAMSDEMHSLAEHVSRRSGEDFKDEPRRRDVSLDVEPLLSSACSFRATDKLMSAPPTGRLLAANHSLNSRAKPGNSLKLSKWSVRKMDKKVNGRHST